MDFFFIICDSNDGYELDLILSIKRYTLLANSVFLTCSALMSSFSFRCRIFVLFGPFHTRLSVRFIFHVLPPMCYLYNI